MGADLRIARRDALVLEHLGLAKAIALNICETVPANVTLDDLMGPAIHGLMFAGERFDEQRNVQFASYAKGRIRGAVMDYLRSIDPLSRDARKRFKDIEAAETAIVHRGEEVDDESVAREINLGLEQFRKFRASAGGKTFQFAVMEEDAEQPLISIRDNKSPTPESESLKQSMRAQIDRAISMLPDRYQYAIRLYFYDELTMKQVSVKMGINESRVSQIVSESLRRMRDKMAGSGLHDFSELLA